MSTPDVPLRMELTIELPGTPEQVWEAIATGNGLTSWFIPSEVEERAGGAVRFDMGEDASSSGTITDWEPPRRLVYAEPDWAELSGHDPSGTTPLVSEFLVEATSGGTCVLRVVSSAFGVGADWEQEFFNDMEKGWAPFFENLRLYLTEFPGQRVTPLAADATVRGDATQIWSAMRESIGATAVGDRVEALGLVGEVARLNDEPDLMEMLVRLAEPVPGYVDLAVHNGADEVFLRVNGYLFADDATDYVQREAARWRKWLNELAGSEPVSELAEP